MEFKDLIKTTEAIAVLGGLVLTVLFGKMFAVLTAAVYLILNVKKLKDKVVEIYSKHVGTRPKNPQRG